MVRPGSLAPRVWVRVKFRVRVEVKVRVRGLQGRESIQLEACLGKPSTLRVRWWFESGLGLGLGLLRACLDRKDSHEPGAP